MKTQFRMRTKNSAAVKTSGPKAGTKKLKPRYKFDREWYIAMRLSGAYDVEDMEWAVRQYIEEGKEPRFTHIGEEGFRCAWIFIRAEIDRRKRRNEQARERRRKRRIQQVAEHEKADRLERKAARLDRKAAMTRSGRKKSCLVRAAKAARMSAESIRPAGSIRKSAPGMMRKASPGMMRKASPLVVGWHPVGRSPGQKGIGVVP